MRASGYLEKTLLFLDFELHQDLRAKQGKVEGDGLLASCCNSCLLACLILPVFGGKDLVVSTHYPSIPVLSNVFLSFLLFG